MKLRIYILLLISLFVFICPVWGYALEYPNINSKIVEVYDMTDNKILYEVDSNKETSIASLTKIVTIMTAIEDIKDLDQEVVITNNILNTVRWDASKAGLKAGDKVTYKDLLYAAMLPSGADATNSIAILSSGSIDNYVIKMNDLVKRLKLNNTHFVNVTGLDQEGHYSTADDMRKILEYSLKNELFRKIYTTREYTLKNGLVVKSTIIKYNNDSSVNTNGILGSKTGYTGDAGYCLSTLSSINSHEFIIIVLNAEHKDDKYYHIVDTVNLIDFLINNYKNQILISKGQVIKSIPIELSQQTSYNIKATKDIEKFLPNDYDKNKIIIKYKGLEELSFKNKNKEKIGTVSYYYDNELIRKDNVFLNTKINPSIGKIIKKYLYLIIGGLLLIIIVFSLKKKKKKKNK